MNLNYIMQKNAAYKEKNSNINFRFYNEKILFNKFQFFSVSKFENLEI